MPWALFFGFEAQWLRGILGLEFVPRAVAGRRRYLTLANGFLVVSSRPGAARRPLNAVAQLADIDLQLKDRTAQSIAVHAELARGSALIPLVLLEYGQDKPLLEFAYGLGIENVAFVHLHDEGFELISHGHLSF
jgi:hypothetical protein